MTPKFMLESPVGNIGFALLGYSHYYQLVAHSAIAINRYCIIASRCPMLWDGGWSKFTYVSLFALPVPGIGLHFVSKIVAVETAPGVYAVVFEQKWIFAASTLAALVYVLITAPLTAVFELKTFVAYRQLSMAAKKRHGHDFRLFVYALTQLVAHVGWTIWFILMAIAGATGDQALAGAVQPLSLYLLDVSCLTGPICLLFTSKTLRRCYGQMFWSALHSGRSSTITSVTRVTTQRHAK